MEGQFLVRQIYEDEITYNLIHAAVDVLRKCQEHFPFFSFTDTSVAEAFALLQYYLA
jgi:hypothetical protein